MLGIAVFTVNFEHISHIFLVFLILTVNKQIFAENVLVFSVKTYLVGYKDASSLSGFF